MSEIAILKFVSIPMLEVWQPHKGSFWSQLERSLSLDGYMVATFDACIKIWLDVMMKMAMMIAEGYGSTEMFFYILCTDCYRESAAAIVP